MHEASKQRNASAAKAGKSATAVESHLIRVELLVVFRTRAV